MKSKLKIIKHIQMGHSHSSIQVRMHESSKLDCTSTPNEYKWAFKHKHV